MNGELICLRCKNYDPMFGCVAFPDGLIPDEIIESNEHDTPVDGQQNKLVFDPQPDHHFDDDDDFDIWTIFLN